jgi:integrase
MLQYPRSERPGQLLRFNQMGRPRKQRRNAHGSAWHWKQTDCWYYTLPGTKKRMPLFDENGERVRGRDQQQLAEQALARLQLSGDSNGPGPVAAPDWIVARVCSEYLEHCRRSVASGAMSKSHHYQSAAYLNDLCGYCGALKVAELKKSHVQTWIENHSGWRSLATHRSVIAIVLAAFNRAEEMHDVPSPLKGLKKPPSQPRLQSLSPADEQALYDATDDYFRDFLFAAVHTGLRPFCELAKLSADHVEVTDRGMMWRVYSSKTKKTRKIPVHREVARLTTRLVATAPKGSGQPLFRNSQNKPWTNSAGVVRFLSLKTKLGWDADPVKSKYSCYTCRHTFAHRMLSGYWNDGAGCTIETLAELMGDTPKVAFDHYGKEWGQHYQEPLWAAIGVAAKAKPGAGKSTPSVRRRKAR